MKKSAKTGGKKPAAKKPGKRTITADADVMPVEEVPQVQVQEAEAAPAEATVAEEPKPTKAKRGRRAATSAAKDATSAPKPLSCLDVAGAVLKATGEPMRCQEMIDAMKEQKLWTSDAPTPTATLSSAILREMKKGAASRFKKTDRGQFALNAYGVAANSRSHADTRTRTTPPPPSRRPMPSGRTRKHRRRDRSGHGTTLRTYSSARPPEGLIGCCPTATRETLPKAFLGVAAGSRSLIGPCC